MHVQALADPQGDCCGGLQKHEQSRAAQLSGNGWHMRCVLPPGSAGSVVRQSC
jgi:hypothetical protein